MAGRVNTKFVILLCCLLLLLVGGTAVLYSRVMGRSAAYHEQRGDALLAEGEPKRAAEAYLRGIGREPDHIQLLNKYIDTAEGLQMRSVIEARDTLSMIRNALRQASNYRPDDNEQLEAMFQFELDLARQFDDPSSYNGIYDLADNWLSNYPQSIVARKYRGIAQAHRISADMPADQIQQAEDDLAAAYDAQPRDAEVFYHLALFKLRHARALDRPGGDRTEATRLRAEALDVSQAMLAIEPDDPDRAAKHLQIVLDPAVRDLDAAREVVEKLEAAMLENPQPLTRLTTVVNVLPVVDSEPMRQGQELPQTTRGLDRARQLLEVAVEAYPESLAHRVLLGSVLRRMGRVDQALEHYDAARAMQARGNPMQTLRGANLKREAAYQAGDLAAVKAASASGAQRTRWLDRADQAADELEELSGNTTGQVNKLRGKVLLQRGRIDEALQRLTRANDQFQDGDMETLLLIADAASRRGDWGLAVSRLRSILGRRPDLTRLRVRLAELLIEHGELEEATEQIDQIATLEPNNPALSRLRAAVLMEGRNFDEALAVLQQYDVDENPQMLRPMVQAYLGAGRRDQARELVAARYDQNPTDLRLMQMLLALTEGQEARLAVIEQARQAGADASVLDVLARQVRGDQLQIEEVIEMMVSRTDDPLEAALQEARLLQRAGRAQAAVAALERAAAIDANHPRVVEMRFDLALRDGAFDRAESLADEAARQNLDLANGAFYRGRLRAAQNQLPAAIELIRQGLEARPEYPEGHRLLGLLLRQTGQLKEAAAAFNRALDNQPDNVQTLVALAATYAAMDRTGDALSAIRRAYAAAPRNAEVFNQYVRMERSLGDPGRVLTARTERARLNPRDTDNRRALAIRLAEQDRYDEGLEVINALIEQEGRTRQNIAALASVHRVAERPAEGLAVVEEHLDAQGDSAAMEDYLLLARYLRSIDDARGMVNAYHDAIEKEDPQQRSASREFADTMFNLGQNETAVAIYEDLAAQNPDDMTIRLRLAEALIRAGRPDEAERLVAQLEGGATTTLLKALAARQRGEPQQAITLLDQALNETDPDESSARAMLLLQRGELRAEALGDHSGAIRDLNRAVDLNPNLIQARMQLSASLMAVGQLDQAARVLRDVLSGNPGNRDARLRLVNLYLSQPDLPAARTLLDEAIADNPDNPLWPQLRARVATVEQNPADAERHWRRALELQPSPQAVGSLASLLLDQQRAADAVTLLDQQQQMVEASPGLQALRGRALLASDSSQAARQVFARAIERAANAGQLLQVTEQIGRAYDDPAQAIALIESASNPSLPAALALGLAQVELAAGRIEPALSRVNAALDQLGDDRSVERVGLMRLRGVLLYQLDRVEEAASAYEDVLALAPNDTQTLNNYAFLLLDTERDLDRAVRLAEQAANQAPANGAVLDTLGWAQFKAGRTDEARMTLQRAATLADLPASHYHLAMVFEAQREASRDPVVRRSLRERMLASLQAAVRAGHNAQEPRYVELAQAKIDQLTDSQGNVGEETNP